MPSWSRWRDAVEFSPAGPSVNVLHESPDLKVVLVGLRAGQRLPVHPGPAASFLVLAGDAVVVVGEDEVSAGTGTVVVVPPGANRGVRAESDVVFLGNLGNPAAEQPPG